MNFEKMCQFNRECAKEVAGSDEWDMTACREAPYFCQDGMISLEGCQGAPVIMSTPHFLVNIIPDITKIHH